MTESFESKSKQIRKHLKTVGDITSWEAITIYGVTRLSAVIFRCKNDFNMNVISEWETTTDRNGRISRYVVYKLIK